MHGRVGRIAVGVSMVVALGTAGCGSDSASGTGTARAEKASAAPAASAAAAGATIDVDELDACTVITDEQIQAFFGERGGEKKPTILGAGCDYEDSSGVSYLSLLVTKPAAGTKYQFNYSKGKSPHAKPVSGLGEEAFTWYNSINVGVDTVYRGVLVHLTQVFYGTLDEKDSDGAIAKLTALAGPVLAQLS